MSQNNLHQMMLYTIVHPMLKSLRTSHFIIRKLFGISLPPRSVVQFDPTTILLSRAVVEFCNDHFHRCLEIGIGQAALVSLSLARTRHVEIHGVDLSPERVEQSREVARLNGLDVNFFVSDLFSNIQSQERYDFIFFNPPYVPTEQGRKLKFTQRWRVDHDRVWDGGQDGTEVLEKFLEQAAAHLTDHGMLLFGLQNMFIAESRIEELIKASSLRLHSRYQKRMIPSTVYILRK